MKFLSLITGLLFVAGSSAAYGTSITIAGETMQASADQLLSYTKISTTGGGTTSAFYDSSSTDASAYIDGTTLAQDLTDSSASTYAYSKISYANATLGFSTPIYNGTGTDLALFFVGGSNYTCTSGTDCVLNVTMQFSITINGITQTYNGQTNNIGAPPTPTCISDQFSQCVFDSSTGLYSGGYNLTEAKINLDDFGLAGSNQAINNFTVFFGDTSQPALSFAGSMYTGAQFPATVPLPMSSLLFGSGLGLLGLIGRRKRSKKQTG